MHSSHLGQIASEFYLFLDLPDHLHAAPSLDSSGVKLSRHPDRQGNSENGAECDVGGPKLFRRGEIDDLPDNVESASGKGRAGASETTYAERDGIRWPGMYEVQ